MPALSARYSTGGSSEPGDPLHYSSLGASLFFLYGHITSSFKAAHCKHSLEHRSKQRGVGAAAHAADVWAGENSVSR